MKMDQSSEAIIREIVLNTKSPIVLRKFHTNWTCFENTIEEWCKKFDGTLTQDKLIEFEQMPTQFTDNPQWERCCSKIKISLSDFLKVYSKSEEIWTAFNYGRIDDVPEVCRNDVDFSCFGFPKAERDISFWLGSKGGNTPCHYDTYGCNIVVQIYGRKKWLLFPPETQLTPTRIPYEESSVYCLENFFSPKTIDSLRAFRENAYECVLEKDDVLIVPRHWWHYVENTELSLSINAWIPLVDIDAQIEECIVKYIVETSILENSTEDKQYILNPNQVDQIKSSNELLKILEFLVEANNAQDNDEIEKYPYQYLSETDVTKLIEKLPYDVNVLDKADPKAFIENIRSNSKRYTETMPACNSHKIDRLQEALLNAIVHPQSIKRIKDIFLKTYSSNI